jgi:CSLREA domain-containing protein
MPLAICTWTGAGGDGLWATATNWSGCTGGGTPAVNDFVVIDNTNVAGSFTVTLPSGAVTTSIAKLTVGATSPNTVTVTLPSGNTAAPGFSVGDSTTGTDDIIIGSGGILKNSSGASSGNGIETSSATNGTLKILTGGKYIHNTSRTQSGNIGRLSSASGTEGGTVEYDIPGTGSSTMTASGATYGNLTLTRSSGSGTYTSTGGSALTIKGSFTINSGVTYSSSMTGAMNIAGDLANNGAALSLPSGQAVVFNGTSNQTISGTASITIGGTATINSGSTVTLARNVTANGAGGAGFGVNGTLYCSTFILSGSATFLTTPGSTLGIGSTDGISSSPPPPFATGNIQTTNRNFGTAGNYIYNGTSAQITGNGLPTSGTGALTIDNSAGVSLSQATSFSNFTLTNGTLTTTNLLTVTNTATTAITGGSSTSYVNGPLGRILPASLATGSTYSFPVGKGSYNPFDLVNPTTNAGGTVTFKAEEFDGNSGGSAGTGLTSLNTDRYWEASITANPGNFTNTSVKLTNSSALSANARVGKSATQTGSYASIGGTVASNTVTSDPFSSFSFFAIGTGLASTTTTVTADDTTVDAADLVTFTATVSSGTPGTITGTVQIKSDGNDVGSPGTLSASSPFQTFPATRCITVGTHTITAVYSGDSNYATSTGTMLGSETISKPAIVVVDDSYAGSSDCTDLGASGIVSAGRLIFDRNAFATIAAGQAGVTPTGTVHVNAGTYTESVTVPAGQTLTLEGDVVIDGSLALDGTLNVGTHTLTLNGAVSGSGTLTSGASGTVIYNQPSDGQNVLAADYGTLTFSNFNKTLASTGTIGITTSFNPGTATGHTVTGSTIEYHLPTTGISTTILPPAFTHYYNLKINQLGNTVGPTGLVVDGALTLMQGTFTSASDYTDVNIGTGTTLSLSAPITVSGNWDNDGTFLANGNAVTFDGAANQTIGGDNVTQFDTLNISNTGTNPNNVVSLTQNGYVSATLHITGGVFDLNGKDLQRTGNVTVDSGTTFKDLGDSGTITMSGTMTNNGTVNINAHGATCPDPDDILITSLSHTQRAWSGSGTFTLTDVTVEDQGGTAVITVHSGTAGANNGLFWFFVASCVGTNSYVWTPDNAACAGILNNDWQCPGNWNPARATTSSSDVLIFDGSVTLAPTVLNIPSETIASLILRNGVSPANFNANTLGGTKTLTISGGAANDLSVPFGTVLKLVGTTGLQLSLTSGSTGSVGGQILLQGNAPHQVLTSGLSTVTFTGVTGFTSDSTYSATTHPFGDGTGSNNNSIIFASGSTYTHGNGLSPFGTAANSVVNFNTGSTARYLTNTGFDANGRTYANLTIGDGSAAVLASDGGSGNFTFDTLTVKSTGAANSQLTFDGSGTSTVTIRGDIESTGTGNGGNAPDIFLNGGASGGISINRNGGGATTFFNTGNSRGIDFEGNATVVSGTTLSLSRVVQMGLSANKTLTVNDNLTGGSTGYVIGFEQLNFACAGTCPKTFYVGTPNGYSPVDETFSGGAGSYIQTVKAFQGQLGTVPGTNTLQRYWNLTTPSGLNSLTADVTFHYLAGDVVGSEADYDFIRSAPALTAFTPTTIDTGAHFATLNGVSSFSDWTLGETTTVVSLNRATGSPTNDSDVIWQIIFADAIDGLTTSNFALVNTGLTSPSLTAAAPISLPPTTTWNISANTGTGQGTLGLNMVNGAGLTHTVTNLTFTGEVFAVDHVAPSTTSFTRQNPASSPTSADVLVFRATFSEDVINVDGTDFAVNGGTTATVTNVTPVSGSVYDVEVSGGDLAGFNGTVGLDLNGAMLNITDAVGNPLPNSEPTPDETYTVDNTAPEINVQGNSMTIADEDITPDAADHTDFGSTAISGGTVVRTFTIQNTGTATLNITGVSIGNVTGGGTFFASPAGSSTVAPSGSTTFTVTFDPATVGLKTATVNVNSDDADESTYNFAIQGTGTAPTGETDVTLSGGNLIISDGNGGTSNDTLTISLVAGPNIRVHETNAANTLSCGAGTTPVDANTCDVPQASVTGNIQVDTLGGNDTLTLSLAGGDFIPTGGVSYNGGMQTSTPGDGLVITGGAQGTVTYNYTNANDGNIVMSAFGTVTYTGLEPITNDGTATDIIFNLPGTADSGVLEDDGTGGNNISRLRSSAGTPTFEATTFTTPTNSVTINLGADSAGFTVSGVDSSFNASLAINGQGGTDAVTVNGLSIANPGGLLISSETINLNSNLQTDGGAIELIGIVETAVNRSIDSNLTAGGSAGQIDLDQAVLTATALGANYGIDASATGAGTGGNVRLGDVGAAGLGTQRPAGLAAYTTGGAAGGTLSFHDQNGDSLATVNIDGGTLNFSSDNMVIAAGLTLAIDTYDSSPSNNPGSVDFTLTAGAKLDGTATGNEQLTIDTTGTLNNVVRLPMIGDLVPLGGVSVTMPAGFPLELPGIFITTTPAGSATLDGDVTLGGDVVLPQNVFIATSGGDISVTGTTNATPSGGATFTLNAGAGDVTLTGAVGNTQRLSGLTVTADDFNAAAIGLSNSSGSLSVTNSGTASNITGAISGTTATLTKLGSGTLTLSGTNTYGGQTTIGSGTLALVNTISNNNIASSSPIDVRTSAVLDVTGLDVGIVTDTLQLASGQTLKGYGTLNGKLDALSGSTVSPGNSFAVNPGILNQTGDVTFNTGATFSVEIGGTTPGNTATNHDQLNVTGAVSPNDGTLTLASSGGFVPAAGQSFVIINNDSTDSITTTFNGLPEGATIPDFLGATGINATITYQGGTNNNDVVLTTSSATPSDISVTKSAPATATEGNDFTYTITISNSPTAAATATGVTLTDALPVPDATFVSVTPSPACSHSAGTVTCTGLPDIAPGDSDIVTIVVHAEEPCNPLNTAYASATNDLTYPTPHASNETDTTVNAAVCTSPPAGMIDWYPADGNANDIAGTNNGTLTNGATFGAAKVNQGFELDGTDDYVALAPNTFDGLTDLTVDAWVKFDRLDHPTSDGQAIISALQIGVAHYVTFMRLDTGELVLYMKTSTPGSCEFTSAPIALEIGRFYHLAATKSGSTVKFYVNGIEVFSGSQPCAANPIATNTGSTKIGAADGTSPADPDRELDGNVDELEIHNAALSGADILAIYNASFAGKCRTCTPPPTEMVSWWDGSGSAPTANDIADGNNGTLQGGAAFAPGKVGQGFSFTSPGDDILVPHNANQNTGAEITVDAWIKPANIVTGNASIINKRTVANAEGYTLELTNTGNGLDFETTTSGGVFSATSAAVLTANVWQHVAATYDGTTIKIYLNGVEVATAPANGAINAVTSDLVIGRNIVNGATFPGLIDEVELFNRALTATEVAAIANAGNAGKCPTSTVTLAVSPSAVAEDGATNLDYKFTRNGDISAAMTVNFSIGGTASFSGGDYLQTGAATYDSPSGQGTVSFAAGEDTRTVTIDPTADSTDESDETVILTVTSGTGYTIGTPGTATGTISNDDATLTLVKTVTNDNGGTKVVSDFPLFIDGNAVTSGTATPVSANAVHTASETTQTGYAASVWGGDCAADGTITLQPGDTKTCTITNDDIAPVLTLVKTVINDSGGAKVVSDFPLFINGNSVTSGTPNTLTANVLYTATETNQAFYAASAWGGDCAVDGTITLQPGDNKTCTITNDDIPPAISINDVTASEGDAGTTDFDFTISLSYASTLTVTVNAQTDNGSATTLDSDYTGIASTPLTFTPSTTTQHFHVFVNGDTKYEHAETFFVNLSGETNATIADGQGLGTINNDDAPPTITISDRPATNEGNPPTVTTPFTFTLTRTGSTAVGSTVTWSTADGTTNPATGGGACGGSVDYLSVVGGLVTFPASGPGSTTQTLQVSVCRDSTFELDETFFVNLTSATDATIADNQALATIKNDDSPGTAVVVNTTNDVNDGVCDVTHCSLREAINAANSSPNPIAINFGIPASDTRHFYYADDNTGSPGTPNGTVTLLNITITAATNDTTISGIDPDWAHSWWSILPGSALPALTNSNAIFIDGYSQCPNPTQCAPSNDGNDSPATNAVLRIELNGGASLATGLDVGGGASSVKGLIINGFTANELNLTGSGKTIAGNFIGTDVSGTLARGNGNGISSAASTSTIGGTSTDAVNLISGNTGIGLLLNNSNSNVVQGNLIGTKRDGVTGLGNGSLGISLIGNGSAFNTLGGPGVGEANIIAFNGSGGISLLNIGGGNTIRGNSIYSNGTTAANLGIDLGADGVTANDPMDPDTGANGLQNFPVIRTALVGTPSTIRGTLNSIPNQTYTIDLYSNSACDDSGNGEGKVHLGSTTANTGANGDALWSFNPTTMSAGDFITATATDLFGNTSEFSACFQATAFNPGTVQFVSAPYTDGETNADHTKTITVSRTGGSNGAVDVTYATSDGTATTAGNDYVSTTGTLHWNNGETGNKSFDITVKGDTIYEADETVNITLSGATISGANPTTLTITNDDPPSISVRDARVAEPASGTAQMLFTVILEGPALSTVTVNYATANGGATPASGGVGCGGVVDYENANGTLTFAPGERVKTVAVNICADTVTPESDETLLLNISGASAGTIARPQATGTITQVNSAGAVLISELRTSGPGGAGDDFVEVYNNSNSPLTVAASDASAGYGLFKMGADCNATPVLIGTIPNGTVLPARGHFLFVGSQYSLNAYASGDLTLTQDIEADRNVAIFSTADLNQLSSLTRLDAVGFGTNTGGGVCDLLREGTPQPPVSGSATEHSFFRKLCDFALGAGCQVPGISKDTNNNAADFMFVDTAGTFISGVPQQLGAPGPENLASPLRRDPAINVVLLDVSQTQVSPPNRVRDFTSDSGNASPFGTLSVRRRVVNNTASSVTRLRFRIVELTTFPSPGGGQADLRARSSTSVVVSGVNDANTCNPNPAPCSVTVKGTTLEQPPNQPANVGGGYNATLAEGTVSVTPLAPGASTNVQFLLGVKTTGTFRFLIIVEALP